MNPTSEGPYGEKRYWGKYRAIVTDDKDPERLGRVKLRVPEILGQQIVTDWAWPIALPYGGGPDYGKFSVPPVGSGVYAEFESGLVDRPLFCGVWYGHPKGQPSDPPKLTREDGQTKFSDDDSTKSPKGDDTFIAGDCSQQQQPKSPAAPKYPSNQVLKTKENGVIVEIDDTPGKSRVHIWHGPSKSWLELDHKGELSIRVADNAYTLVEKDDRHHVKGSQHTAAEKNLTYRAGADYHLQIAGKEVRVTGGTRDQFTTGEEKKVSSGGFSHFTTGEEKKVSSGGFKHFTIGDRVDVVIGNYQQFVVGRMETNVFGFYSRLALTGIEDAAPIILHRGGAPTSTPPSPPSPPAPPVCA
jgi:uncharacterized protein involved in type VI secretion and phage assembly